jgi:hypothetical protein
MTRKTFHLIRLVLLLVATLTMGLHYAVVQMVGWVNMTVEYSQSAPLSEALVMTFDGKHPCELCKLVANELGKSDQDDRRAPEKEVELKLPPVICWTGGMKLLSRSHRSLTFVKLDDRARFRRERPPLPPPREV